MLRLKKSLFNEFRNTVRYMCSNVFFRLHKSVVWLDLQSRSSSVVMMVLFKVSEF